eukprot:4235455-Alexandrium_andersonii.AAC.1
MDAHWTDQSNSVVCSLSMAAACPQVLLLLLPWLLLAGSCGGCIARRWERRCLLSPRCCSWRARYHIICCCCRCVNLKP